MKIKVSKIDMSGVNKKVSSLKKNNTLGNFAVKEAIRFMEPWVPLQEGFLSGSAESNSKPWKVIYNTPYARYQYKGVYLDHKGSKNPSAKSYWDKGIGLGEKVAMSLEQYIKRM